MSVEDTSSRSVRFYYLDNGKLTIQSSRPFKKRFTLKQLSNEWIVTDHEAENSHLWSAICEDRLGGWVEVPDSNGQLHKKRELR